MGRYTPYFWDPEHDSDAVRGLVSASSPTVELPELTVVAGEDYGEGNPDFPQDPSFDQDFTSDPRASRVPGAGGDRSAAPTAPEPSRPPPHQDPWSALAAANADSRQRQVDLGEEPSVNGWALLADLAFNKGRSISGILSSVERQKAAYRADKRALAMQRARQSDPVAAAIRMKQLELQGRGLDYKEAWLKQQKEGSGNKAEQENAERDGIIAYLDAHGVDTESYRDAPLGALKQIKSQLLRDYDVANKERLAGVEGEKAYGRESGKVRARSDSTKTIADTEAAVAKARSDATLENDLAKRDVMTASQSAAEERAKRAEARSVQRENASWLRNFSKDTTWQRQQAIESAALQDSIARHEAAGEDTPGIGFVESLTPDLVRSAHAYMDPSAAGTEQEALENRARLRTLANSVLRRDTGAAANLTEDQRNQLRTASKPGTTMMQARAALKIIDGVIRADYASSAAGRPDLAVQSMRSSGIDPARWGIVDRSAPQSEADGPYAEDPELGQGERLVIDPETGDQVVDGPYVDSLPVVGGRTKASIPEIPKIPAFPVQQWSEEDDDIGVGYGR